MNTKDALPAVAAVPALLPLIAPFAAPILIGGAIAAGLIWLFSGDETPAAEMTNAAPDAPKTLTDAERTRRVREIEAELAATRRERDWLNTPRTVSPPAVRTVTHQAAPAVAASPRSVAAPVAMPARDVATAAAPRCVTPLAQPAPRDAVPMIAPRPATPQAAPAEAVAASVGALDKPKRFQLRARKYDRAHLEAVLKAGPLSRPAVVKALKAAPFNYGNTVAYATLQRFADALEQRPDGLLAWKTAQG